MFKVRVATVFYFIQKEEGKNNDKSLRVTGFGGWLCKGKVLAPSTSVVLHRNLFACVYVNALFLSFGSLDWGDEKRNWFYCFWTR